MNNERSVQIPEEIGQQLWTRYLPETTYKMLALIGYLEDNNIVGDKAKDILLKSDIQAENNIEKVIEEKKEILEKLGFKYPETREEDLNLLLEFKLVEKSKNDKDEEVYKFNEDIKSPVEREVYVDRVSKETDISHQIIKQEINKNSPKQNSFVPNNYKNYNASSNSVNISPVQYMLKPAHLTAEKELLNIIINNKDIYQGIKDKFLAEDFLDPIYRKLAEIVYSYYEDNHDLIVGDIKLNFQDDEQGKVEEIFSLNVKTNKDIKAIEDYIKNINYYKINMKKESIKKQLNIIDSKDEKTSEDIELFNKLCLDLLEIDKRLKIN